MLSSGRDGPRQDWTGEERLGTIAKVTHERSRGNAPEERGGGMSTSHARISTAQATANIVLRVVHVSSGLDEGLQVKFTTILSVFALLVSLGSAGCATHSTTKAKEREAAYVDAGNETPFLIQVGQSLGNEWAVDSGGYTSHEARLQAELWNRNER